MKDDSSENSTEVWSCFSFLSSNDYYGVFARLPIILVYAADDSKSRLLFLF